METWFSIFLIFHEMLRQSWYQYMVGGLIILLNLLKFSASSDYKIPFSVFLSLWLDQLCVLAWLHKLLHQPFHLRRQVQGVQTGSKRHLAVDSLPGQGWSQYS